MQSQPILIPHLGKESGDRWVLTGSFINKKNKTGDWVYHFNYNNKEYKLIIPFGFLSDGSSVPRFLRAIVKMGGREMPDEAWLPHDFFYEHKGKMPKGSLFYKLNNGEWNEVSEVARSVADKIFRNELKKDVHGLSKFKPIVAYIGVRAAFWKKF